MQCQKVQSNVSAYLDGELEAASARLMAHHISQCEGCREIVADFEEIDVLLRGLPKLAMSQDFAAQLLQRTRESDTPVADSDLDRSLFAAVMRFLSNFMELIEAKKSPSTHTLNEFSDFPPSSMGHIYCKILDLPGRG